MYETIDLKVKIIKKAENKQVVVKNETPRYKADTIVADQTQSIKLILWENIIDKVHAGKCYHIQNLTIRIFDDIKFVNTNEATLVTEIDDIQNINLATPEIEDNLLIGEYIGVEIKRSSSCIVCNKSQEAQPEQETITCTNCKITTLATILKTKLVCQLFIKTTENKIQNFTCFNDAIQSFLTIKKCETPLSEIQINELQKLLLTAGQQRMIADKSTKIISQFLSS